MVFRARLAQHPRTIAEAFKADVGSSFLTHLFAEYLIPANALRLAPILAHSSIPLETERLAFSEERRLK
jgi:hypothetical protein